MFATRDQENLIRAPYDPKSAKPLGNGVVAKQNPKTPGKGLATPFAPRTNRAPFGVRSGQVTNFKTPGPLTEGVGLQKTQKRSSGKKPKLKVHQPSAAEAEPESKRDEEGDEPEIEYCPPKITELPDEPDEMLFGQGHDFSQFQGANIHAGIFSFHMHEKGEDGLSRHERQKQQNSEFVEALAEHEILKGIEQTDPENWTSKLEQMKQEAKQRQEKLDEKYFGGGASKPNTDPQKKPPRPAVSTTSARAAAAALSQHPQPRFAAPTAAAKARQRGSAREPDAPIKRNLPSLASKSTVGYSKGRKVAATLRPLAQAQRPSKDSSVEEQEELFRKLTFRQEDQEEESDPLFNSVDPSSDDWLEQTFGNFRLPTPIEEEKEGELQT